MCELMEVSCVWNHIRERLMRTFGDEKMKEITDMFHAGHLACMQRTVFGQVTQCLYIYNIYLFLMLVKLHKTGVNKTQI